MMHCVRTYRRASILMLWLSQLYRVEPDLNDSDVKIYIPTFLLRICGEYRIRVLEY